MSQLKIDLALLHSFKWWVRFVLTHWGKQKWCRRERVRIANKYMGKTSTVTITLTHFKRAQVEHTRRAHTHAMRFSTMLSLPNTSANSKKLCDIVFFLFFLSILLLCEFNCSKRVSSTTVSHTVLADWRWSATRTKYMCLYRYIIKRVYGWYRETENKCQVYILCMSEK